MGYGESKLIEVKGLKELDLALKQFSTITQGNMVTSALRAGAKPVVSKAREGALRSMHPSSGALAESIGVKAQKKGGEHISIWVGSMRKGKEGKDALHSYVGFYGGTVSTVAAGIRHGHLIELGTARGVAKRPFLRPALDGQAGAVVSEFKKKMRQLIKKETKKIHNAQKNRGRK